MRINEVLNSKYYITEEDTMTLADVQVMYGDDPEMMAAIQKAKMPKEVQKKCMSELKLSLIHI